jgi:hypothetical protein
MHCRPRPDDEEEDIAQRTIRALAWRLMWVLPRYSWRMTMFSATAAAGKIVSYRQLQTLSLRVELGKQERTYRSWLSIGLGCSPLSRSILREFRWAVVFPLHTLPRRHQRLRTGKYAKKIFIGSVFGIMQNSGTKSTYSRFPKIVFDDLAKVH